jgi:hypothetical protein
VVERAVEILEARGQRPPSLFELGRAVHVRVAAVCARR